MFQTRFTPTFCISCMRWIFTEVSTEERYTSRNDSFPTITKCRLCTFQMLVSDHNISDCSYVSTHTDVLNSRLSWRNAPMTFLIAPCVTCKTMDVCSHMAHKLNYNQKRFYPTTSRRIDRNIVARYRTIGDIESYFYVKMLCLGCCQFVWSCVEYTPGSHMHFDRVTRVCGRHVHNRACNTCKSETECFHFYHTPISRVRKLAPVFPIKSNEPLPSLLASVKYRYLCDLCRPTSMPRPEYCPDSTIDSIAVIPCRGCVVANCTEEDCLSGVHDLSGELIPESIIVSTVIHIRKGQQRAPNIYMHYICTKCETIVKVMARRYVSNGYIALISPLIVS